MSTRRTSTSQRQRHGRLRKLKATVKRFRRDEGGASSIEYALVAGGISIAIVIVVFAIGAEVLGLFDSVETAFEEG